MSELPSVPPPPPPRRRWGDDLPPAREVWRHSMQSMMFAYFSALCMVVTVYTLTAEWPWLGTEAFGLAAGVFLLLTLHYCGRDWDRYLPRWDWRASHRSIGHVLLSVFALVALLCLVIAAGRSSDVPPWLLGLDAIILFLGLGIIFLTRPRRRANSPSAAGPPEPKE